MRRPAIFVMAAAAAASLACSINVNVPNFNVSRVKTGPVQTLTINQAAPAGAEVVDLNLSMTAGKLDLSGGADSLVSGEVLYNVPDWTPAVTATTSTVDISQGPEDGISGIPDDNVINEWTVKLGSTPMNLTVRAGAYEAHMALGGVPLRSLQVNDGASDATLTFSAANPEPMGELVYVTGASSAHLSGLANANFSTMNFSGGAGEFELDFSGELQRDAQVEINAGLGSLKIIIPAGTHAVVTTSGGLHNVDAQGAWSSSGDRYETGSTGPVLTISIDMGAGNLELVAQ